MTIIGIVIVVIGAVLLLTGSWLWCKVRRKASQSSANQNILRMNGLAQKDLNEQPLAGRSQV